MGDLPASGEINQKMRKNLVKLSYLAQKVLQRYRVPGLLIWLICQAVQHKTVDKKRQFLSLNAS